MQNPRDFGRKYRPALTKTRYFTPAERASSWFQHQVAFAATQELKALGETTEWLAGRLNVTKPWLLKKLHGQAPASLQDLLAWALELGVQILPEVESAASLLAQ